MPKLEVEISGIDRRALRGKVAVVTGAGRGLGREIALALAWLGADIVVAEIEDTGTETAKQVEALGRRALFVPTDVGEESSIYRLAVKSIKAFGGVDILVNNAALAPVVSVDDTDTALWDRVLAVNLRGPFLLVKALFPDRQKAKDRVVINILSGVATNASGLEQMAAYSVSKAGLASFTVALAPEMEKKGVNVCGLWVGMTDTPGGRDAFRKLSAVLGLSYNNFLAQLTLPGHVAAAVAYLVVNVRDYHGTTAEDREILARLGLVNGPVFQSRAGEEEPVEVKMTEPADLSTIAGEAEAVFRELSTVVDRMEEGFNRLPMFIRPIAVSALRKQTGLNLREWRNWTSELLAGAGELSRTGRDGDTGLIPGSVRRLVASEDWEGALLGLAGYLKGIPEQVARFTKDQEGLRQLAEVAHQQEQAVLRARRLMQSIASL
ncbi:MAG: SDR family NAD(P)-dependent oxidoreductase [Clostridia bacterium]|nr:SDR family NAD(P)-dependent oxidoreductase [Clostridia bacterium]MDQ7792591.1 SDR family NAD(P)-dependent oxidoreductase [Clostridia bacterium]